MSSTPFANRVVSVVRPWFALSAMVAVGCQSSESSAPSAPSSDAGVELQSTQSALEALPPQPAGLVHWMRADACTTDACEDPSRCPVVRCSDLVQQGVILDDPPEAQRPLLSELGGRPALRFDGVDDRLAFTDLVTQSPDGYTVVAVAGNGHAPRPLPVARVVADRCDAEVGTCEDVSGNNFSTLRAAGDFETVQVRPPELAQVLRFGSGDRMYLTQDGALCTLKPSARCNYQTAQEFTIAAAFRPNGNSVFEPLSHDRYRTEVDRDRRTLSVSNGTLQARIIRDYGPVLTDDNYVSRLSAPVTPGEQIVVVWTGSHRLGTDGTPKGHKLYVNGVLVAEDSHVTIPTDLAGNVHGDGDLSELAIYDRALEGDALAHLTNDLMQRYVGPQVPAGAALHLRADTCDPATGQCPDLSGNGREGRPTSPSQAVDVLAATETRPAVLRPQGADRVYITQDARAGAGICGLRPFSRCEYPTVEAFTISAVIRQTEKGYYHLATYPRFRTETERDDRQLYVKHGTLYAQIIANEGTSQRTVHSGLTGPAPIGELSIVTWTANAEGHRLYINGELIDQDDSPAMPTELGAGSFSSGVGQMAELLMYEGALDGSELAQLHASLLTRYDLARFPNRFPSGDVWSAPVVHGDGTQCLLGLAQDATLGGVAAVGGARQTDTIETTGDLRILSLSRDETGSYLSSRCSSDMTGTAPAPNVDVDGLVGSSTTPFQGDLAELLVFNRKLTDDELSQVRAYLALRYGVEDANCGGAFCGDGIVDEEAEETCDDGFDNGIAGRCQNDCQQSCPPASEGGCSPQCACDEGDSGCVSDADCRHGLSCYATEYAAELHGVAAGVGVCVVAHCANGVQDQGEHGLDCGGRDCVPCSACPPWTDSCSEQCPCAEGQGSCLGNNECVDGLVCAADYGYLYGLEPSANVCVKPLCANGTRDGGLNGEGETGVDCGGDCAPCPFCPDWGEADTLASHTCTTHCPCVPGTGPCAYDAQCAFGGRCFEGVGPDYGYSTDVRVCDIDSCRNGVLDIGELGVDCGGYCGRPCTCGNGVIDPGEVCDPAAQPDCRADCSETIISLPPYVPDGLAHWLRPDLCDLTCVTPPCTGAAAYCANLGPGGRFEVGDGAPFVNYLNGVPVLDFGYTSTPATLRLTPPDDTPAALNITLVAVMAGLDGTAPSGDFWTAPGAQPPFDDENAYAGFEGSAVVYGGYEQNNPSNRSRIELSVDTGAPQLVVLRPRTGVGTLATGCGSNTVPADGRTVGVLLGGSIGSDAFPFRGRVAELMIFSRYLDDAELAPIKAYLADRHRLDECTGPYCGNGTVDAGELCEPVLDRGCRADCSGPLRCGNGDLDPGEDCDPGLTAFCDNTCLPTPEPVSCTLGEPCPVGQECGRNNGAHFGKHPMEDVCWPVGVCPDTCGEANNSACGSCVCEPDCSTATCEDPSDGCGGTCGSVCDDREVCTDSYSCQAGSRCVADAGPQVGQPDGTSVCLPEACEDAQNTQQLCGSLGDTCGRCPERTECLSRECGPDGAGGSCGTCGDGDFCLLGQCRPVNEFVDDDGPEYTLSAGAEVGTMPGNFSVSDMGTAQYSIPIELPPGPGGLVPSLSFTYDSSAGHSTLGWGWSVSGLSTIGRCKKTFAQDGIPAGVQGDPTDPLCFGSSRLVAICDEQPSACSDTRTEYRTELDSFTRIIGHGPKEVMVPIHPDTGRPETVYLGGPQYFEAWMKDGRVLTFGSTADSRKSIETGQGRSMRYVYDAEHPVVVDWYLDKIQDRSGNEIRVEYQRSYRRSELPQMEMGVNYGTYVSEVRPVAISYGGRVVAFRYGETQSDFGFAHRYVTGMGYHFYKPLRELAVTVAGQAVRTYKLEHERRGLGWDLQSIQLCDGRDEERCLPKTSFGYQNPVPSRAEQAGPLPTASGRAAVHHTTMTVLDWDHDGRDDILYTHRNNEIDGDERAFANLLVAKSRTAVLDASANPWAADQANLPFASPTPIAGFDFIATIQNIGDIDWDGRQDLAMSNFTYPGGRPWREYGAMSRDDGFEIAQWPFAPRDNVFDADGDGRADRVFGKAVHRGRGDGSFGAAEPIDHGFAAKEGDRSQRDLDGDGIQEIVRCGDDEKSVFIGTASGGDGFLSDFCRDTDTVLPFLYDSKPVDFNGDGLHDRVVIRVQKTGSQEVVGASIVLVMNTGRGFIHWKRYEADADGNLGGYPCVQDRTLVGVCHGVTHGFTWDYDQDGVEELLVPLIGGEVDPEISQPVEDGAASWLLSPYTASPLDLEGNWESATWDDRYYALEVGPEPEPTFVKTEIPYTAGVNYIPAKAGDGAWTGFFRLDWWEVATEPEHWVFSYGWPTPTKLDVDGDGVLDLVVRAGTPNHPHLALFRQTPPGTRKLKTIVDGVGNFTDVTYADASNPAYTPGSDCEYPARCLAKLPHAVVRSYTQKGDYKGPNFQSESIGMRREFAYHDARTDVRGRGWIGFGKREISNFRLEGGLLRKREITYDHTTYDDNLKMFWLARRPKLVVDTVELDETPSSGTPTTRREERRTVWTLVAANPDCTETESRPCVEAYSGAGRPFVTRAHEVSRTYDNDILVDWVARRYHADLTGDGTIDLGDRDVSVDRFGNSRRSITEWPDSVQMIRTARYKIDEAVWLVSLPEHVHVYAGDLRVKSKHRIVETDYDDLGRPLQVRRSGRGYDDPAPVLRTTTDIGYDGFGNASTSTTSSAYGQAPDRGTTITYDEFGVFPVKIENSVHMAEGMPGVSVHYDPLTGRLVQSVAPNGDIERYHVDTFGRSTGRAGVLGSQAVKYERATGWICQFIDGKSECRHHLQTTSSGTDQPSVVTRYNGRGLAVRETTTGVADEVLTQANTYDSLGRLVTAHLPTEEGSGDLLPALARTYDNLGRVVSEYRPYRDISGAVYVSPTFIEHLTVAHRDTSSLEPEWFDRMPGAVRFVRVQDPHRTVSTGIGRRGLRLYSEDAAGSVMHHGYGPFGALELTEVDGFASVEMQTDERGLLERFLDGGSGVEHTYFHNGFGDAESETRGGQLSITEYDGLGRVVAEHMPDVRHFYEWDGDGADLNMVGKLRRQSSDSTLSGPGSATSIEYAYDGPAGLVSEVTRTIEDTSYTTQLDYTSTGTLETITYPLAPNAPAAAFEVSYEFDEYGRPTFVGNKAAGARDPYWEQPSYGKFGEVESALLGNGAIAGMDLDPDTGELRRAHVTRAGSTLFDEQYWYRSDGKLAGIFEYRDGATTATGFDYDLRGRLKEVTLNSEPFASYDYGDFGTLKSKPDVSQVLYATAGRPAAASSVDGQQLRYDDLGRVVRKQSEAGDTYRIDYAAFDLPYTISRVTAPDDEDPGTPQASYAYDSNHQRVMKQTGLDTLSPAKTTYVGDLYRVREQDGAAEHVALVPLPGGQQVEVVLQSTGDHAHFYVHTDRLGSGRKLSDETRVPEPRDYRPFGAAMQAHSSVSLAGFTGHEHDQDTPLRLINMRGRLYDPQMGRFMTPDPVLHSPFSTQGLDPYSYVSNDPVNLVDPSGFCENPIDGELGDVNGNCADPEPATPPPPKRPATPPPPPAPPPNVGLPEVPPDGTPDGLTPDQANDLSLDRLTDSTLVELFIDDAAEIPRAYSRLEERWQKTHEAVFGPPPEWAQDLLSPEEREILETMITMRGSVVTRGARATTNATRQALVVANGVRGRAFERAALKALKAAKNNQAVTGTTRAGKVGRSIPDAMHRGITEVKDVINLSMTQQLQIQFSAARQAGVPFNLVVSPRTLSISGPLRQAVQQTGGTIQVFDSATRLFRAF